MKKKRSIILLLGNTSSFAKTNDYSKLIMMLFGLKSGSTFLKHFKIVYIIVFVVQSLKCKCV